MTNSYSAIRIAHQAAEARTEWSSWVPSETLIHNRSDIWQKFLIGKVRKPILTDDPVKFFSRLLESLRMQHHGQKEAIDDRNRLQVYMRNDSYA